MNLNHYVIQLTGSAAVKAIEVTEQFSTDTAAIGWACKYAKHYYPVYFQGSVWRLEPMDKGGEPRLIATLKAEVEVKAKSEAV